MNGLPSSAVQIVWNFHTLSKKYTIFLQQQFAVTLKKVFSITTEMKTFMFLAKILTLKSEAIVFLRDILTLICVNFHIKNMKLLHCDIFTVCSENIDVIL